jgi:hypothetical protein
MEFAADCSHDEVACDDDRRVRDRAADRGKYSGGCVELAALLRFLGGEVTNEVLLDLPERITFDVYGTWLPHQVDEHPLFDA